MSIIWFVVGFLVACFLPDSVDQFCKGVVVNLWRKLAGFFQKKS